MISCGALPIIPNTEPATDPRKPTDGYLDEFTVQCSAGYTPPQLTVICEQDKEWHVRGKCLGMN